MLADCSRVAEPSEEATKRGRGKPVKPPVTDTTTPPSVDTTTPPPPDTTQPPPSTEVSMWSPVPTKQSGDGSCVAQAVGYAARTIDWYYKTGEQKPFLPEFLYNLAKFSTCEAGTSIQRALDVVINRGICTWQSLPYSGTNGCDSSIITEANKQEALNYKISGYTKFSHTDTARVKEMVRSNKAVVFSFFADNTFINARAGFIWKVSTGNSLAHACAVIGYDDSKNAFKIINSFGTEWGDGGYGWIDYRLFYSIVGNYVYVIN